MNGAMDMAVLPFLARSPQPRGVPLSAGVLLSPPSGESKASVRPHAAGFIRHLSQNDSRERTS